MSEILIFTILATIAAVYSILPKHRQLRLGYSIGAKRRTAVAGLAIGILLLYVISLYFDYVVEQATIPGIGTLEASTLMFSVEVVQLVFALLIVSLFLAVFFRDPPTVRNAGFLREQMQQLMNDTQYNTLTSIIEDNYDTLIKEPTTAEESVAKYTETILLDTGFSEHYALNNPQLGVQLITDVNLDEFARIDAVDLFLRVVIKHESSILYREIRNNKHRIDTDRYEIPEENQLLYALLDDCDVAHQLRAYQSIGDTTLHILEAQGRKDRDEYNHRRKSFSVGHNSDEVFRDPVFVAIRFFDIMVSESIYQGMQTHMWLYYYTHFTDQICENYEITDHSNPNEEFANDYSYLLYEMFSTLENWVRLSKRNPDSITVNIKNSGATVENGDILKSSTRCLIQCHREILTTDEIPSRFKRERTESLFKAYFKLAASQNSDAQKYSEALLAYMEQELQAHGNPPSPYRSELQTVFSSIEPELRIKEPMDLTLVDDIKSRLTL